MRSFRACVFSLAIERDAKVMSSRIETSSIDIVILCKIAHVEQLAAGRFYDLQASGFCEGAAGQMTEYGGGFIYTLQSQTVPQSLSSAPRWIKDLQACIEAMLRGRACPWQGKRVGMTYGIMSSEMRG